VLLRKYCKINHRNLKLLLSAKDHSSDTAHPHVLGELEISGNIKGCEAEGKGDLPCR
jgi:hypothetical protein